MRVLRPILWIYCTTTYNNTQTVNAVVELRWEKSTGYYDRLVDCGEGDEGVEIIGVEPICEGLVVAIQATRPCTTSIENLM